MSRLVGMPKIGPQPAAAPGMLIRMRCEACHEDHRMMVGADTPLGALPEITKRTFTCKCKRKIPTITKMDKSLMSINGVPFRELKGLSMFIGTKESKN